MPNAIPLEDPPPDPSPAVTRRRVAWGGLGILLGAAAATRLTGAVSGSGVTATVQLLSLAPDEAARALSQSAFDASTRAVMLAAIRSRRLHLVRAPFFGIGAAIGAPITVACGATVRLLVLTADPIPVLLPIERLGRIFVTTTAPAGQDAGIGLVTAVAPVTLSVPPGGSLTLDVIVQ